MSVSRLARTNVVLLAIDALGMIGGTVGVGFSLHSVLNGGKTSAVVALAISVLIVVAAARDWRREWRLRSMLREP